MAITDFTINSHEINFALINGLIPQVVNFNAFSRGFLCGGPINSEVINSDNVCYEDYTAAGFMSAFLESTNTLITSKHQLIVQMEASLSTTSGLIDVDINPVSSMQAMLRNNPHYITEQDPEVRMLSDLIVMTDCSGKLYYKSDCDTCPFNSVYP